MVAAAVFPKERKEIPSDRRHPQQPTGYHAVPAEPPSPLLPSPPKKVKQRKTGNCPRPAGCLLPHPPPPELSSLQRRPPFVIPPHLLSLCRLWRGDLSRLRSLPLPAWWGGDLHPLASCQTLLFSGQVLACKRCGPPQFLHLATPCGHG